MYDNSINLIPADLARRHSISARTLIIDDIPVVRPVVFGLPDDALEDKVVNLIIQTVGRCIEREAMFGSRQAIVTLTNAAAIGFDKLLGVTAALKEKGYITVFGGNDSMAELLIQW